MGIIIRKAKREDMPSVLDLIKELAVYEKCGDEVELTAKDLLHDGFGELKRFDCIVAEKAEEVIGMALYYYRYSTWKGKYIYLEDIVVKQSERRGGVGSLLFKELLEICRDLKVKRFEWQVLNWNKPAVDFYKKFNANFDDEWINCGMNYADLKTIKID